ncbi:hypothetical protein BS47DRAFT_940604 [Hydnum rufescens UP504]|uniref:Major facilitator superfamily (MFS) profile domain-containing protein n=1 Tax=Hydnum rufescens UP504 TaxID=1448309 RepID=A0A9P6AXS9_9AGAM|nr:hypothetical protein BS47DRAFT_940604 [Hydnum rufescens UP504]
MPRVKSGAPLSPDDDVSEKEIRTSQYLTCWTTITTNIQKVDVGGSWFWGAFYKQLARMPLAYGVFQEYYTSHNVFPGTSGSILSLLGTTNGAVMPITSFFFGKLADRYGYRRFIILGSISSFCGIFGSAWCTKLWHYFLTQGVVQSVRTHVSGLNDGEVSPPEFLLRGLRLAAEVLQ